MAEGLSNVACFSITTLLVVSLANLVLLMFLILEWRNNCISDGESIDSAYRIGALQGGNKQLSNSITRNSVNFDQKFMAALVMFKEVSSSLICGTIIVSKFWVLTSANCCYLIKGQPLERLKVVSNSENWKRGKKHSIENFVIHANYTAKSLSYNVCLIKTGSPFKEQNELPAFLASSYYHYITDTLATTLGWSSNKATTNNNIYSLDINLISFQRCQTLIKDHHVDKTMVCAYNIETHDCRFDSGGPLIQNNIVIGIASYEINCDKRIMPRLFTRISFFEKWFELVEKEHNVKINATFKY
ncbi:hypothetical protein ABEB36_008570 [Hypothenemus hampei]|uniref:Peptidase S1 domain-containing protein n=1 Tax=Hypothenemus hampei TaxID=57062 RepID=A0ABD1ERD6_HYPHA